MKASTTRSDLRKDLKEAERWGSEAFAYLREELPRRKNSTWVELAWHVWGPARRPGVLEPREEWSERHKSPMWALVGPWKPDA